MTIPVFYRPEQSSSDAASYSPSADKPRQVVADWTAHEDIAPRRPDPDGAGGWPRD